MAKRPTVKGSPEQERPRAAHPAVPRLFRRPSGTWQWKPEKRLRPRFQNVSLGKRFEEARDEARRLNREAEAWLKTDRAPKPAAVPRERARTLGQVIEMFRAPDNTAWRKLRPRTQAQYRYELDRLHDEFGHEIAATITKARVLDWAEALAFDAPQTARHVGARGRSLYNWAIGKEIVVRPDNPFSALRLPGGNKRTFRFLWEDVLHLLATADAMGRPSVGKALVIAFATTQRITDVITWSDDIMVSRIDKGRRVTRMVFEQSKRIKVGKAGRLEAKVTIDMPIPPAVSDVLARYPAREALAIGGKPGEEKAYWIVSEKTGRPYHEKTVSRVFARVVARALVDDKGKPLPQWKHLAAGQLRDGRRSGFVHRIEQGASVEVTCSISGHDITEGYDIVSHYLPRTVELADQADKFMTVRLG